MHRLTDRELIRLRDALDIAESSTIDHIEKTALKTLREIFEYGCGVDVRTCDEETQRILNEELEA